MTKSKWIPASERLPELKHKDLYYMYSDMVLMRNEDHVFVGSMERYKDYEPEVAAFPEDEKGYCKTMTHWMPLPEPPEE